MFLTCGLASLLATLPPVALRNGPVGLALGLAAGGWLAASWTYGYARDRAPRVLDVVDALAFTAFSAAGPDPGAVLPVVFAALWFRTTYGTTRRSLVRCVVYLAGLVGGFLLWPLLPGHATLAPKGSFVPLVLVMFLTVAVGRTLTGHLVAREQSAARDTALAAFGTDLLGITDAAGIVDHAWRTAGLLCSRTPGLRMLLADEDGAALRVLGAEGGFRGVPATLPAGLVPAAGGPTGAALVDDEGELTAAVGVPCAWTCIPLPHADRRTWVLVGAPGSVPADALAAVLSLTNQVVLALRNTQVHEELTAQASTDALTGLANRLSFSAALADALAAGEPTGGTAVLFIDLDDFKNVNDGLGHAAGDALLREVATRLRAVVRPGDVCARLGGDEFAVLLAGTTAAAAEAVAQRLVDRVAAPVRLGEQLATVGASVGVALAGPGTALEELVQHADTAMYAAKANGKNRVQSFRDGLLHDGTGDSLSRQLGTAAASGQLVVHYQPVLSLPELHCTSVEALVRWRHPERGLLYPAEFVALAEQTGAILDIGAFVLDRACRDAAGWRQAHPGRELAVHVNVSTVQLNDEGFRRTVTGCLATHSLPPAQLVLEITETTVLSCPAAIAQLQSLSALGVRIAVDDFGTGYSALTTLRVLPVDIVKIDRSFVAGSTANPADAAVIEAVVQMASRLGLTSIAEGVETLEQQRLLAAAGADSVQGFRYFRPAPYAEFSAWLDARLAQESAAPPGAAVLSLTPRRSA